jgi:AraC-like DNA-binding protein
MLPALQHRPRRELQLAYPRTLPGYQCRLYSMGWSRPTDPAAYRWDNNIRSGGVLFQYTLAGAGAFRDGATGVETALPPGSAILTPWPSNTRYWLPAEGSWEFLFISFGGDAAEAHARHLVRRGGYVRRLGAEHPAPRLVAEIYAHLAAGGRPDEYTLSAQLYRFLMELYPRPEAGPGGPPPEPLAEARRLMTRRLADAELTVADLAAAAGYSRYHFSRLFRERFGRSPYAYLLQLRLQRAQELLLTTDQPVAAVGRQVGFGDAAHFCHAFRRAVGVSPGRFRAHGEPYGPEALVRG